MVHVHVKMDELNVVEAEGDASKYGQFVDYCEKACFLQFEEKLEKKNDKDMKDVVVVKNDNQQRKRKVH